MLEFRCDFLDVEPLEEVPPVEFHGALRFAAIKRSYVGPKFIRDPYLLVPPSRKHCLFERPAQGIQRLAQGIPRAS
jgi:hypothetical protein